MDPQIGQHGAAATASQTQAHEDNRGHHGVGASQAADDELPSQRQKIRGLQPEHLEEQHAGHAADAGQVPGYHQDQPFGPAEQGVPGPVPHPAQTGRRAKSSLLNITQFPNSNFKTVITSL